MSLCFSPVGEAMRARARKFPGLVNCTVIDWFQPWTADALFDVALKFLTPIEELGPEDSEVRAGSVITTSPVALLTRRVNRRASARRRNAIRSRASPC